LEAKKDRGTGFSVFCLRGKWGENQKIERGGWERLANLASQPYKNTKSRSHRQLKFPLPAPVFSLNPEYHHENKPNPASRQTYWEPSYRLH